MLLKTLGASLLGNMIAHKGDILVVVGEITALVRIFNAG